jgi:hypothetical protein
LGDPAGIESGLMFGRHDLFDLNYVIISYFNQCKFLAMPKMGAQFPVFQRDGNFVIHVAFWLLKL